MELVEGVGFGAGEPDRRTGVMRGQECAAPRIGTAMAQRGADRDEARQILVFAAKSVSNPAAHAGANESVAAGVQFEQC